MKRLMVISLMLLVILSACNRIMDEESGFENDGLMEQSQEQIWLDSLCSRTFAGRKVGTVGNALANSYVVSEVSRMGYTPVVQGFIHESGLFLRNILITIPGM